MTSRAWHRESLKTRQKRSQCHIRLHTVWTEATSPAANWTTDNPTRLKWTDQHWFQHLCVYFIDDLPLVFDQTNNFAVIFYAVAQRNAYNTCVSRYKCQDRNYNGTIEAISTASGCPSRFGPRQINCAKIQSKWRRRGTNLLDNWHLEMLPKSENMRSILHWARRCHGSFNRQS